MTQVFKRVEECPPVKGFRRSIIYDLSRKTYHFIPHALHSVLTEHEGQTIEEVKLAFDSPLVIDEYFEFLLENEYIFLFSKEEYDQFRPLTFNWDYPALITNAILCRDGNSTYDLKEVFSQIENLGCRHVLLFSKVALDFSYFETLLHDLNVSSFQSIEIHTCQHESLHLRNLRRFVDNYPRVRAFIVHSAAENRIFCAKNQPYGIIAYVREQGDLSRNSGTSLCDYFNVNIQLFSEAQQHNVFYNRKLIVDASGRIRNTLIGEEPEYFVGLDNIRQVVETHHFQRLWKIPKDSIEVCKDCEFRYMCTDSRIPIQTQDGTWHFETECAYNPYLAKWKGEKGYQPLQSPAGI
ncbi:MAG TPA: grasp-with-spasm system SPASM domain peptide maturase [Bacteroidia bacterium]|jgi:SPASM domain peptide maturase of grasp-with-spasm system|nr:grasp-with-spasm system SPASM domain peptide maturase [Bacteroidia bacterium]